MLLIQVEIWLYPKEFMDTADPGYDYCVFSLDTNIGDSLGDSRSNGPSIRLSGR